MNIKKVAVIGAGTMGSGIAGQAANAGIEVLLLDMPADDDNTNAVSENAVKRLVESDPPGVMDEAAANRIECGNIRDDLAKVAECDWVAEAVVERLDIKQQLYRDVAQYLRADAILSSNTSTIPISLLTKGMDDALAQRFAITHFFNPVRFMRLLELVRGEKTRDDVMHTLALFCEEAMGKGIVDCADTPGFIANRVGVFALQCALHEAFNQGLSPSVADAIFGRPMGIPKTGVFGLYDLIGIDLMADVVQSLVNILEENDRFHNYAAPISVVSDMIANNQLGMKSGQGFYIEAKDGKQRQMFDFKSGNYAELKRAEIEVALKAEQEGVRILLDDDSVEGQYAWRVLSEILVYSASIIPEVGDAPAKVDEAMKLGYNWLKGPFELIDEIGLGYFLERLRAEGRDVPPVLSHMEQHGFEQFYRVDNSALQSAHWVGSGAPQWRELKRADGIIRFNDVRQTLQPINSNELASWYAYQDCAIVEFHSKANALESGSMAILADALAQAPKQGLKGVIIHNDAQHFSCGVNLGAVRAYVEKDDFDGLDAFLDDFQQTVHKMSVAPLPVIAAPVGLSIGGGFEVVLHAQRVISHANSVMGLVESGVGVIPSGGGCKEMLYRWQEQLGISSAELEKASLKAFFNIGFARTATSPQMADKLAMRAKGDRYLMNRDRILSAAIADINDNPMATIRVREPLKMPGAPVYAEMVKWLEEAHKGGQLTAHEIVIGSGIATILTGGEDVAAGTEWTEQDIFDAERRVFLKLAATDATQERIRGLLDDGMAIRN